MSNVKLLINTYLFHVSRHAGLTKAGEKTFSHILGRKKASRRYGSSCADLCGRVAGTSFYKCHICGKPSERKMTTLIYVYCLQQFLCLRTFGGPNDSQPELHNYRNRTTCKHASLFRWSTWLGTWIAGVCPTTENGKVVQHGSHEVAVRQLTGWSRRVSKCLAVGSWMLSHIWKP